MKTNKQTNEIQACFVTFLDRCPGLTTEQILKQVAYEFNISASEVANAITKAPVRKKGARK